MDEKVIMGINTEDNYLQIPIIKAQAILVLSKFWQPSILDSHRPEQEIFDDLSFLLVRTKSNYFAL
jgi:hypothetical protein